MKDNQNGTALPVDTETTFYAFSEPAFQPGNYSIEVEQKVTGTSITQAPYKDTKYFSVLGQRFDLDATQIHNTYPPQNTTGDYSYVLPHVVFNNHTFAWQRSPTIKAPEGGGKGPYPTWLGVFLFDQNDPAPIKQQVELSQLLPANLPANTISYPNFELDYGEIATQQIHITDIPVDLFNEIAPSLNDLNWMSHSRSVSPEHTVLHETTGTTEPQEYCSVVGNRLPERNSKSSVYLVSLEHMAQYLPADDGTPSAALGNAKFVRLTVLQGWSFNSIASTQDFDTLLKNLDKGPLQRTPVANSNEYVQKAFNLGYTAANHQTREGGQTVSWYHGPLIPYEATTYTPGNDVNSRADEVLRYDPDTGMFDVSYASAWQIGQLLALNDRNFALALYQWKKGVHEALIEAIELKMRATMHGLQDSPQLLAQFKERPIAFFANKVIDPDVLQRVNDTIKKS